MNSKYLIRCSPIEQGKNKKSTRYQSKGNLHARTGQNRCSRTRNTVDSKRRPHPEYQRYLVGNRLTVGYVATSTNCAVLRARPSVLMMIWRVAINRTNTSQKKATVYDTADKCAQHFSRPISRCNPPDSCDF
jgi:hypothetical protein